MLRLTVLVSVLIGGCTKTHPVEDAGDDAAVPSDGSMIDAPDRPDAGLDASADAEGDDAGLDAAPDDAAPDDAGFDAAPPPPTADVDLLFMVDNSNSMAEEQASLVMQFPRLVSVLLSGDLDADGVRDFEPVRSLQVGVVNADMGVGGYSVPTCASPLFGDDGILRTRGNTGIAGCMATYPRFLEASAGSPVAPLAMDFSCVAAMGTGGCGFEQQLEATLKALTPRSSPLRFFDGSRGHGGDGVNAGFLRDDSLLVIIYLTDEEDCSAVDTDIFNPSSTRYTGDLNLRCFMYPEAVHPVERFVNGLAALRHPSRLIFAAIVGVPLDVVGRSYDEMLAHPNMIERVDPAMPTRLVPSCNVPGRGIAFPPRRFVHVAQGLEALGVATTVQSICQSDLSSALAPILEHIAAAPR
jgi:hypothetical protein